MAGKIILGQQQESYTHFVRCSLLITVVVKLVTFCVLYRQPISSCPDHCNFIA